MGDRLQGLNRFISFDSRKRKSHLIILKKPIMREIFSELEALHLLVKGDEGAFEYLFHIYYHKVFHFVSHTLPDKHLSEDITQNVFVKLWEMRGKIDPEKSIKNLLFIMARNSVYNQTDKFMRRERYKKAIIEQIEEEINYSEESPEAVVNARLLSELLDEWIEQMPAKRREIFVMSRKQSLSNKEIAEQLGISQKTVETQVRRAMEFLRSKLDVISCFLL